jgi:hypothetical protein
MFLSVFSVALLSGRKYSNSFTLPDLDSITKYVTSAPLTLKYYNQNKVEQNSSLCSIGLCNRDNVLNVHFVWQKLPHFFSINIGTYAYSVKGFYFFQNQWTKIHLA